MTAPTLTSARAPEPELSHGSVNEPSMEDILASIRRIIAEDQSTSLTRGGLSGLTRRTQPSPPAEPVPTAQPEPALDVAEAEAEAPVAQDDGHQHVYGAQTEVAAAFAPEPQAEEPVALQHAEPLYHSEHLDPAVAPVQAAPASADMTQAEFDSEPEPLMSPATGASISSSFQTLAESVMLQDPGLIERVMRESMRPLLKAWLDDHLPSIVERLVRAEIERVARGGRARNT